MRLALTPDGKWDIATADLVSAAAAAGFTAVGVNAGRVDAAAEQLAERAKTIGAQWVLTVFTDKVPAERITRCAKLFDDAGAGLAVEYTPLGAIPTISDGMEYVRAAGRTARAGLMVDSWHFGFSDNTWEELAALPLEDIAYVQFTDALEPEYRDRMIRESLHRRALPGDGILELRRFATTLLDRGWDGTVSVEVLSAELRRLPVDALAERLYATTAPYWT